MSWDGKERRKDEDQEAREMLIRIDTNVANLIDRFHEHVKKDEDSFKELRDGQDGLKKYVYVGIGGVFVLEFFFKLMK